QHQAVALPSPPPARRVPARSARGSPGRHHRAARGESPASHRGRRGAPMTRRDDREYREYLREEQRSQRGCIAGRMQLEFHRGLACGVLGAAWRSLEWFQRLGDVISDVGPRRLDITAASALILQHALPLVLGLGACLLIAPLALYLVLSDD